MTICRNKHPYQGSIEINSTKLLLSDLDAQFVIYTLSYRTFYKDGKKKGNLIR
ncbi:hypothetical protein PCS8106_01992 [Streptococcus pneumoniae PCS8106]|nr:hypothetical protein PCS8106_01992 [Streptococcus pneumoniae PCS8106]